MTNSTAIAVEFLFMEENFTGDKRSDTAGALQRGESERWLRGELEQ